MDKRKELIAYFERAKDLEVALHTHNTLQPAYLERLQNQQPVAPVSKETPAAKMPVRPEEPKGPTTGIGIFLVVLGILFGLFIFLFASVGVLILAILSMFGCCFFISNGMNIISAGIGKKQQYEKKLKEYEAQWQVYQDKIRENEKKDAQFRAQYQQEKAAYTTQLQQFNNKKQMITNCFSTISNKLETALDDLYSKNVIFPKYRNLVAVTTILEYLSSGRCSELEGPNGAYNLYEMELRQNIVIAQLSTITRNLEGIRNNQYTLYQEISNSNRQIRDMLQQIGNEASLTNYHAQINTLALTSPKISYGIIL